MTGFPSSQNHNKPVLLKIMTWQTGDRPLSAEMMVSFNVAYVTRSATNLPTIKTDNKQTE